MKIFSCISAILFFIQSVDAQIFEIKNASKLYDVKIDMPCEKDECEGEAGVTLLLKETKQVFQKFHSDELRVVPDKPIKEDSKVLQLYSGDGDLIFGDFNFDGSEDLAIRNSHSGPYGSPVYNIYVFNKTRNKFVLSNELSTLTQENIGMFDIDHKTKRIKVMTKDGCCYHIWSEYQVVPRKGLLLVREFIEDATSPKGDQVEVTDRNLIKGKWKEKTKYYPVDQYYK